MLLNNKKQIINLDKRLLFIYGATATGKTLLAELISYGLGKKELGIVEELKQFERMQLEIETETGKYVISRSIKKQSGSVACKSGSLEDFDENTATKLQLTGGDATTQFSWFLLDKTNIPAMKSLPHNISASSKPSLISFRDIFNFCYLSQDRIDSSKLFGLDEVFELPKAIDAFEVMFNIKPIEESDKEMELLRITQKVSELTPKIEYLKTFLNSYKVEKKHEVNQNAEDELKAIKEKISKFDFNKVVSTEHKNDDKLDNINKLELELDKKKNKRLYYVDLINKWEQLLNTYKLEQNRIALTARASSLIDSIEFKLCPGCGQTISNNDSKHCSLCRREYKIKDEDERAINIQLKRLIVRQDELFTEIQQAKDSTSNLDGEIELLQSEIKETKEGYIARRKLNVDPKVKEYQELCLEAGKKEADIEFSRKLTSMMDRLEDLKKEYQNAMEQKNIFTTDIEKIRDKSKSRKKKVREMISVKLNKLIKDAGIPAQYKTNVAIDEKTYLPTIDGESYLKVSSGGLKVYFMVAYFLSLIETALEFEDNHHPRLVIIDSIHKNISTKEKIDEQTIDLFFRKIIEIYQNHEGVQIIILDNEVPEFVKKDFAENTIHFTRDEKGSNGLIKV